MANPNQDFQTNMPSFQKADETEELLICWKWLLICNQMWAALRPIVS